MIGISEGSISQAVVVQAAIEAARAEFPPVVRATADELSDRAALRAADSADDSSALEVLVKGKLEPIPPLYVEVPRLSECPCGEVWLPVGVDVLTPARAHKWFRVHSGFNRIFYRLLAAVGVSGPISVEALRVLSKHKRHLDLTAQQVRGAWGLQCGVFTVKGRIARRPLDRLRGRTALDVEMVLSEGEDESEFGDLKRSLNKEEWPILEAEALEACEGKPDQVDFQTEMKWILSRTREWPDFSTAPSQIAVKTWLLLNDPAGVDSLMKDLLKMTWAKRMAPGDAKGGGVVVFEADRIVEAEGKGSEYDKALEDRLFGAA